MGLFSKSRDGIADNKNNNPVNSDEYERLHKRITELDTKIEAVKTSINLLQTDVADLRGAFNSRLAKIRNRGIEESEANVESFNNSVEVPFG